MSDCCKVKKDDEPSLGSHAHHAEHTAACCDHSAKVDWLLWGAGSVVCIAYLLHFLQLAQLPYLSAFNHGVFELFNTMFWGLLIGVLMVAVLAKVPREFVLSVLGDRPGLVGVGRATLAGLLLDLCSHGILMVGAKLYERGASIGQVMAFLIASPWNSLSLTVVLIALIGWQWTLVFIVLSAVIAVITGLLFDALVARRVLPENPHRDTVPSQFQFWAEARRGLSRIRFSWRGAKQFLLDGLAESRMVIRWLMVGIVLASLIRAFVAEEAFAEYFGPTALGLLVTLLVATVIEVCSEGSTPIAADIFTRAQAPGNAFAFLMAGVSTDYTEIMVLRERTRSWKIALFLPILTLPQILAIGLVINAW